MDVDPRAYKSHVPYRYIYSHKLLYTSIYFFRLRHSSARWRLQPGREQALRGCAWKPNARAPQKSASRESPMCSTSSRWSEGSQNRASSNALRKIPSPGFSTPTCVILLFFQSREKPRKSLSGLRRTKVIRKTIKRQNEIAEALTEIEGQYSRDDLRN